MRITGAVLLLLAGCCFGRPADAHELNTHDRVTAAWAQYGLPTLTNCQELTYTRTETVDEAQEICTEALACDRHCGQIVYPMAMTSCWSTRYSTR